MSRPEEVDTVDEPEEPMDALFREIARAPEIPLASTIKPLAPGALVADSFRIDRALGRGGMGIVYLAQDLVLDRPVALKLQVRTSAARRTRLLREAKALARLSHPNVVSVHEVGKFGEGLFIAMEFVDGWTAREWLAQGEREVDEILDLYVNAGHGLAAAHEVGLVHRDFKPENVLVGHDGRVRVADFGLARDATEPPETVPQGVEMPEGSETATGVLFGTPAYMAPEQRVGAEVDARADQFAFCVALYEAIHGERPDEHAAERRMRSGVPARVIDALARGLSTDASDRYPSMHALLDDLWRDPVAARTRRIWAISLTVGVTLAGAGVWAVAEANARLCTAAGDALQRVWNPERAARVREAFIATDAVAAVDTADRAIDALGSYAGAWSEAQLAACEATHIHATQSEETLERRRLCLERRRRGLEALVSVFERADADVVAAAPIAITELPRVSVCADASYVMALVPPPDDRGTAQRVSALRDRVADVVALSNTGKIGEALENTRPLVAEAKALGYAPLVAEVMYTLGVLLQHRGEYEAAEPVVREAYFVARTAGYDEYSARAAGTLAWLVGYELARHQEAELWLEHAIADVRRGVAGAQAELELAMTRGVLLEAQGRAAEAIEAHQYALEVYERIDVEDRSPKWPMLLNLGAALHAHGRYEDALATYAEALALQEQTLGPNAVALGSTLTNTGLVLGDVGRYAEAVTQHERALEVYRQVYSADHPDVTGTLLNLGIALAGVGRYDESVERLERALGASESRRGPDHPMVALCLSALGYSLAAHGELAAAREHHERALRINEHHGRGEEVAVNLGHIGAVLAREGKHAQTADAYAQAVTQWEQIGGADNPRIISALTGLGDARVAMGQLQQAVAPLERALELRSRTDSDPASLADVQFSLARALIEADRPRALELGASAAEIYGRDGADEAEAVQNWLRQAGTQ